MEGQIQSDEAISYTSSPPDKGARSRGDEKEELTGAGSGDDVFFLRDSSFGGIVFRLLPPPGCPPASKLHSALRRKRHPLGFDEVRRKVRRPPMRMVGAGAAPLIDIFCISIAGRVKISLEVTTRDRPSQ